MFECFGQEAECWRPASLAAAAESSGASVEAADPVRTGRAAPQQQRRQSFAAEQQTLWWRNLSLPQ